MLLPLLNNRKVRLRGIIAELVSVVLFNSEPDFRKLVRDVSNELWHLGFAPRFWFYENADAYAPNFCDQLIEEKPDSIVWLMPTPRMTELGYRLMNCGIHVIRATAVTEIIDQLLN